MLPPNWVILAIPLFLLCLVYWVYSGIRTYLERRYLHAVFDGDRVQQWRNDRLKSKRNAIHNGRRFY